MHSLARRACIKAPLHFEFPSKFIVVASSFTTRALCSGKPCLPVFLDGVFAIDTVNYGHR